MRGLVNNNVVRLGLIAGVLAIVLVSTPAAHAVTTSSTNSQLSQQITAGTISTSIRDAGGAVVASPSFTLGSVAVSTVQQTATGTFGSNTQRITVDNPGGADNGWVLSLAATSGASATWVSGGNSYAFNGTAATGQLTINPAAGTLTPTGTNTATGITKGTSAAFASSTPITLLTAGTTAEKIWNGYITGIGVSQTIPASQPVGTYTISLTQTLTSS